jgi:hypothetical protein
LAEALSIYLKGNLGLTHKAEKCPTDIIALSAVQSLLPTSQHGTPTTCRKASAAAMTSMASKTMSSPSHPRPLHLHLFWPSLRAIFGVIWFIFIHQTDTSQRLQIAK